MTVKDISKKIIHIYNNTHFSCEMDWKNMIAYRNYIKMKVFQSDEYHECYFLKDVKIRNIHFQPILNYLHLDYPLCGLSAEILYFQRISSFLPAVF